MSDQKGPGEYATIIYVNCRYGPRGRETVTKDVAELVEVSKFETQPALIQRGYGLTLNQGNYESARVDVSLTLPCYVEDLEHADEYARKFVEERIQKEVASVRGGADPKPKSLAANNPKGW